ncbi:unnamed protein product [Vicia faba]|uniref:Uncharacterized protein n=1 Tax=Vicia faba TaxID=3906 RepID=A0AAV0YTL4_VICFA|nr:unnamed protein product [Vicia faba]
MPNKSSLTTKLNNLPSISIQTILFRLNDKETLNIILATSRTEPFEVFSQKQIKVANELAKATKKSTFHACTGTLKTLIHTTLPSSTSSSFHFLTSENHCFHHVSLSPIKSLITPSSDSSNKHRFAPNVVTLITNNPPSQNMFGYCKLNHEL